MRRELERIEIPGEHEARERAWPIVRAAFSERERQPRPTPFLRPLLVAATLAALVAAAFSPAGRAVLAGVREAIGVADAEQAFFSLPQGRLLVTSPAGVWRLDSDGSARLLGRYEEAAWSPFGRFVAASRGNELLALELDGDVRWKLARPEIRFPRWGGTRTDTRIAYLSGDRLRIVAGDGTSDAQPQRLPRAAPVAPAWRPLPGHVLAFVGAGGRVHVFDTTSGVVLRRSQPIANIQGLSWSHDGTRLLVVARGRAVVLSGRMETASQVLPGTVAGAYGPGNRIALVRRVGERSELRIDDELRFSGTGTFRDVAWSPDGTRVLVAWPEADQLVFVPAEGPRRVRAVANVSAQFESGSFPRVAGWCCP